MKYANILRHAAGFKPLIRTASVQAAAMSLKPGESSSERVEDEHPRAEQWLYVVSGAGVAIVRKRRLLLRAGMLVLIPKNTPHRVTNTGSAKLLTLNFYSPPAYSSAGNVKSSVKRLR